MNCGASVLCIVQSHCVVSNHIVLNCTASWLGCESYCVTSVLAACVLMHRIMDSVLWYVSHQPHSRDGQPWSTHKWTKTGIESVAVRPPCTTLSVFSLPSLSLLPLLSYSMLCPIRDLSNCIFHQRISAGNHHAMFIESVTAECPQTSPPRCAANCFSSCIVFEGTDWGKLHDMKPVKKALLHSKQRTPSVC